MTIRQDIPAHVWELSVPVWALGVLLAENAEDRHDEALDVIHRAIAVADLRCCDNCGRVEDAGDYPDWINGACEECDPEILNDPSNLERI
jgi:hypothetical protein